MLLPFLLLCFAFECLEPDIPEALEKVPELDEPLGTCPVEAPGAVAPLAPLSPAPRNGALPVAHATTKRGAPIAAKSRRLPIPTLDLHDFRAIATQAREELAHCGTH